MVASEGNAPPSRRYQHLALLLSYEALAGSTRLERILKTPEIFVLPITLRANG